MSKDEAERDFACILCDFACNDRESFQVHQGEHKAERPFKCCECAHTAHTKNALATHMYSQHNAKKKYQCRYCSHRTVKNSDMVRHIRIHTSEKPFKCDECDFRASQKRSLTVHKMIHLKIRPLRCNLCDQQFIYASALHVHIRIHTGEKPYKCLNCGFETSKSSGLSSHQKSKKCKNTSPSNAVISSLSSFKPAFPSQVNSIEGRKRKPYNKKTEKLAGYTSNLNNRSETARQRTPALPHRLEVPALLALKVLENWTVGQDPYAIQDVTAETEITRPIHKSVKSKMVEEIVVVASEEDHQDRSSSTVGKASGPLPNSNERRDPQELLDENSLQVPETIDSYLNALGNNRRGRARPYACAECTFTCFREERLQRHYRRNHSGARAIKVKTEYVHKSEQVFLVDKSKVRVSSCVKLKACHEVSSAGNRMSVSVVRTETSTEEGIESRLVGRVLPSPSTLQKCSLVKSSMALKVPEKDTCDYCDKRFSSAFALLDHLRHHSGQTLFKCNAPGCIFKTINKQRFNIHERNHL